MSFNFKQFSIQDSNSAMKVGVDAVLLGAWADAVDCRKVLDLGAGTGIVSLMLAQRNATAQIDCLELNNDAFIDLQHNIKESNWSNRLNAINADFLEYDFPSQYDFIISNPPFFKPSDSKINSNRKTARIADSLSPDILSSKVSDIISDAGRFVIIYPFERRLFFIKAAFANGLYMYKQLIIYDTKSNPPVRCILCFTKETVMSVSHESIIMKKENGNYTEEFKKLTKEFYIK